MREAGPYRLADAELLAARRDELLATRRREVAAQILEESPAASVYITRFVRSAFGLAGLGMAALLLNAAIRGGALTPMLDASWLTLGVAVLASRPLATIFLRSHAERELTATDDVLGDLAALEDQRAERVLGKIADRIEERSVALPLSALALLLPLTLHRLAALILDSMGVRMPFLWIFGAARPMDAWIRASMVMVGHCHVLLVFLACAFARDLRRHPDFPENALGERAGWAAFAWTSLASIPSATLCLTLWPLEGWLPFLLIPTLVTVTGLTFIPPSFLAMGRAIARERALIRV